MASNLWDRKKEREWESNRKITLDDCKSPTYLKCVSYLKGIPFKLKAFIRENQRWMGISAAAHKAVH